MNSIPPGPVGVLPLAGICCLVLPMPVSFARGGDKVTIRLIVVDDREIVRKALASLLAGEDIEIVAEGATGKPPEQAAPYSA